ncbi:type VI secretion system tube protein Hcp [Lewinella sp. IMCC34183]|uniref:type VI secretion system tube protein Hcp n=1 Tax=Lewinella sp. IMCC34183 TaxID=2248762 RepID=UPI000E24F5D0|nr:type VI secretion system tube protein Hcp [Lewinella sp. IMCC34183]
MITLPYPHLLVCLLVLILPSMLTAQLGYALEIPDIPGEETRLGFEDQITISSFSYGVSSDDDGGSSRPSVTQGCFLLGKFTDRATPFLFDAVARHRRFDEITFTAYRTTEGTVNLIVYELRDVKITKWETGAEDGTAIEEVIGLVAEEVEVTYYLQDPSGGQTEYSMKYNFATPR